MTGLWVSNECSQEVTIMSFKVRSMEKAEKICGKLKVPTLGILHDEHRLRGSEFGSRL